MQRRDDLILVVTSEDESTILLKLFDASTKKHLHIRCSVVCLINDDDLMLSSRGQRDSGSIDLCLITDGIEETTFVRSVDNQTVSTQLCTQCLGDGSLTDASRPCEQEVGDLTLLQKTLKDLLSALW